MISLFVAIIFSSINHHLANERGVGAHREIAGERARLVAAPMAGQAAVMGAQGGAQAMARRASRMLPR